MVLILEHSIYTIPVISLLNKVVVLVAPITLLGTEALALGIKKLLPSTKLVLVEEQSLELEHMTMVQPQQPQNHLVLAHILLAGVEIAVEVEQIQLLRLQ
jgi:hypothetical protein